MHQETSVNIHGQGGDRAEAQSFRFSSQVKARQGQGRSAVLSQAVLMWEGTSSRLLPRVFLH